MAQSKSLDWMTGTTPGQGTELDANYDAGEAVRDGIVVKEVDTVPAELMEFFFND